MDAVSVIGVAAASLWGLALAVHAGSVIASFIQPAMRRRSAARADRPAVSIVIPVKNMEPDLDTAFASVFSQHYPEFEVLVTAAEDNSPAIEAGRKAAAQHPKITSRFVLGNKRFTLNPKVSNLAPAMAAATHDLIMIKDANIHLADGQLAEFVRNLTPGTGMVCAVPVGVQPETFSAEIECAMMNGHAAPLLMAASVLRLNIGFGKVMLFNRRDFDRVDGIATMAPTFGDDHALAKALARIGLRTIFTADVIRQVMGARTLRNVWERQLRWMVIRRDEEPLAFYAEPFASGSFAVLAAAAAAPALGLGAWTLAIATLVLWLAGEILVLTGRRWEWSWWFPLAAICREFLIVAMWARAWSSRKVRWSGNSFELSEPRWFR